MNKWWFKIFLLKMMILIIMIKGTNALYGWIFNAYWQARSESTMTRQVDGWWRPMEALWHLYVTYCVCCMHGWTGKVSFFEWLLFMNAWLMNNVNGFLMTDFADWIMLGQGWTAIFHGSVRLGSRFVLGVNEYQQLMGWLEWIVGVDLVMFIACS